LTFNHKPNSIDVGLSPNTHPMYYSGQIYTRAYGFYQSVYFKYRVILSQYISLVVMTELTNWRCRPISVILNMLDIFIIYLLTYLTLCSDSVLCCLNLLYFGFHFIIKGFCVGRDCTMMYKMYNVVSLSVIVLPIVLTLNIYHR
jgi:hypothetical protein